MIELIDGLLACFLSGPLARGLAGWLACSLVFRYPCAVVVEYVLLYRKDSMIFYIYMIKLYDYII